MRTTRLRMVGGLALALALSLLLTGLPPGTKTATAAEVGDTQLAEAIRAFNGAGAVFPLPELSAPQRQELREGRVVKLLLPDGGNLRVVGMLLIDLPRDQVWVAGQDVHFASPSSATEARLSVQGDRAVWYGYLDLPAPFSDRHWVVDSWNNHDLAARSGNRMWEHPWQLHAQGASAARPAIEQGKAGGITLSAFEAAIYTPVNRGAWVFIDLGGEQTLLAYHATSEVGGNIPERLVAEFVKAGLEDLLRRVERIARDTVPGHYTAGHPAIPGGDGRPVPLR